MANISAKSVNLTGDTIQYPGNRVVYTAENVTWGEIVEWKVTNGILLIYSGTSNIQEMNNNNSGYTEWSKQGPDIDVQWDDIAEKGRISYTVRNNLAKQGYADVEILSVTDSQVDTISVGNFNIYSDIIYIPKGVGGSAVCSADMVYSASRGGSGTSVTEFKWEFPASMGGGTIESDEVVSVTYDANSGDGEKIIVTPISKFINQNLNEIVSYGQPRSFTIKRFEGVLESRNITGTETFTWEDLIVRNVNIFQGANVTLHGGNSVLLSPEFQAYVGSEVLITADAGSNNINEMKFVAKRTAGKEDSFEERQIGFSQNYPNPCSGNTMIDYCQPEDVREASLYVVSSTGQIVRNISISELGRGVLNLDVSGLLPGIYLYYMVTDGKMSGCKRMVISDR